MKHECCRHPLDAGEVFWVCCHSECRILIVDGSGEGFEENGTHHAPPDATKKGESLMEALLLGVAQALALSGRESLGGKS